MKDWKAIAKAGGLDIPDRDLERLAAPLDALEATFRPLAQSLTPDLEPAVGFRAEGEGQ